jgi:hypothetical protein
VEDFPSLDVQLRYLRAKNPDYARQIARAERRAGRGWTVIAIAIGLLVFGCLFGAASAHGAEPTKPQLVLWWNIANSGHDFGSVGWVKRDGGWPRFIREHIKPAIDWCRASGVEPIIFIHHPWGQYSEVTFKEGGSFWEPMHLDGWDYAKAANAKWLINDFATETGWKPITREVKCYGYVGGVNLTPRLRNLPPAELAATIRRNLKPFAEAGFRGMYVDAAAVAIAHAFVGVNVNQSSGRSLDTLTLEIADAMFPERTGVEGPPRAQVNFAPLHSRNFTAMEHHFRSMFDPTKRPANYKDLGYDRNVLKGKAWRLLTYGQTTLEDAQAIVREGDVPGVIAVKLMSEGVKASDVFKEATE